MLLVTFLDKWNELDKTHFAGNYKIYIYRREYEFPGFNGKYRDILLNRDEFDLQVDKGISTLYLFHYKVISWYYNSEEEKLKIYIIDKYSDTL